MKNLSRPASFFLPVCYNKKEPAPAGQTGKTRELPAPRDMIKNVHIGFTQEEYKLEFAGLAAQPPSPPSQVRGARPRTASGHKPLPKQLCKFQFAALLC